MDTKKIWKGVKTVVTHPAVTGAVQGALAAYITDVRKRRSGKGMSLLAGIGIGAVVGGGLVLLFATQGGKDLRAKLMKTGDKAAIGEGGEGGEGAEGAEGKGHDEVRHDIRKPDGVPTNHATKHQPPTS